MPSERSQKGLQRAGHDHADGQAAASRIRPQHSHRGRRELQSDRHRRLGHLDGCARVRPLPRGSDTLDAVTDRTGAPDAARPRAARRCARADDEPRSTAGPCPLWSIGASVVNILPLETQVKHRSTPPARYHTLKLEVCLCVRGVMSPLLANIFLHYVLDLWLATYHPGVRFCRYADDGVLHCRTEAEANRMREHLDARLRELRAAVAPGEDPGGVLQRQQPKRHAPERAVRVSRLHVSTKVCFAAGPARRSRLSCLR